MKLRSFFVMFMAAFGTMSASCVWADQPDMYKTVLDAQTLYVNILSEKSKLAETQIKTRLYLPARSSGVNGLLFLKSAGLKQTDNKEVADAPFHGRLGLMLSPDVRLTGGFDYTIASHARTTARLDAESLESISKFGFGQPVVSAIPKERTGEFDNREIVALLLVPADQDTAPA